MVRYFSIGVCVAVVLSLVSCKTAKLSDALEREALGEYYEAAQIYKKVYAKTSAKDTYLRGSIAFHQGEMFQKINNPSRASSAYTNAIRTKYADSTAIFHQAQTFQKQGKYPDAIKRYTAFLDTHPADSLSILAKNGISGCELAQEWKKTPTKYSVRKMDKLMSRDGEFSPVLLGTDQLYFNSARKEATGDEKSAITGVKNNDFFMLKQDERGNWLKPDSIDGNLNTEFDEGTASFTADGSQLYYTFCPEGEGSHTAEVRVSNRSGAQWGAGTKVELFRDTTILTAHPAVGVDGYLYFAADAPGGYGGKDLWRVPISSAGVYYPENLGPDINTPGDELFPAMRDDSTLYFSSDGHPGMGGLDIFRAKFSKERWRVENMKAPVNSMADDFGITFYPKIESGFFSSNRNDGRGADHIYSFDLPGTFAYLEGWVLDKEEIEIPGASVRVVGKDGTNQRIFTYRDGTYLMTVEPGMEYVMMASAPDFLNQKQTLTVPQINQTENFYVDFYLSPMTKPVVVDNIFYDFNKATLREESKGALDSLIVMLNDNPNVTIEMAAHTDRIGTEAYNDNLSQRRAQSVVDYLIRGGIDKERLEAKGYGKSDPFTVTKKIAETYDFLPEGQLLDEPFIDTLEPVQQAIADQINRRTAFKVLSTNYKLM
ncbi:MAG: OmpA family protein [Candidatus Symbiothrix sp.]|jgi:peptidoglycan-associated lipoprotein|nr:OmpA family protein [Candidatus Symbiothrix sp.]